MNRRRRRRAALLGPAVVVALLASPAALDAAAPAPAPSPALRSAIVVRGTGAASVVIRLTADLPRRADRAVAATARVGGRATGAVTALDLVSFRHYCFRAALKRPWPVLGRTVRITLRSPRLARPLHTARIVVRARPGDATGARLGCRLPPG